MEEVEGFYEYAESVGRSSQRGLDALAFENLYTFTYQLLGNKNFEFHPPQPPEKKLFFLAAAFFCYIKIDLGFSTLGTCSGSENS